MCRPEAGLVDPARRGSHHFHSARTRATKTARVTRAVSQISAGHLGSRIRILRTFIAFGRCLERQRGRVDTIAQTGRLWTILEDVPKM